MHSICSVDKIQSRPEHAADSQRVQIAKKKKRGNSSKSTFPVYQETNKPKY